MDSAADCQALCRNTLNCVHFSLVRSAVQATSYLNRNKNECWLKKAFGNSSILDGAISGPKRCGRTFIKMIYLISLVIHFDII